MGKVVARRRSHAQCGNRPGLEPQPITDIIEAERMRQLHKNHRRQMAPDTEGPRLGFDAMPGRGLVDDGARNILEELPQRVDMMTGWLV